MQNKIEERIKKNKLNKEVKVQVNFQVTEDLKETCAKILQKKGISLTEYLVSAMELLSESK